MSTSHGIAPLIEGAIVIKSLVVQELLTSAGERTLAYHLSDDIRYHDLLGMLEFLKMHMSSKYQEELGDG